MRSTRVRAELAAALAGIRAGAGQGLAAWPVLVGRCVFFVLLMVVLSTLWDRVAAERASALAVAAPDAGFAVYVGVTEWITLSLPHLHLRFEDEIRRGGLEPALLRPKSHLLQILSQSYGGALARLAVLGVVGLAMLALSGRPVPTVEALTMLPLLGMLALMVGVLLYALAGLAAFWTPRTLPLQLVIQKLMFLLGGLFAPITLYPDWLERISAASPFAAHLYWAGAQALEPSMGRAAQGLAWQVLWIGVLGGLCALVWRAGIAKVLREGGA
ncbi:MAG: ABC-2 family transporter protein [Phenylobacterium sp.]